MFSRIFIIFLFLFSAVYACESNCLNCHPKLKPLETNPHNKYYKEHHFLTTCTKCHKNHPEKGDDKCGADCFECHSRQKLIQSKVPEHRKLNGCTKCHKSLEFENMNDFPMSDNPTWKNKLKGVPFY
jgi:hypothetical protein